MPIHENNPEVLASVPNDLEAAMIVSALAAEGIDASTSGGYTSGFRAEAPGDVQVIVRDCDLERAQVVLSKIKSSLPVEPTDLSSSTIVATGIEWKAWHSIGLVAALAGAMLYLWSSS